MTSESKNGLEVSVTSIKPPARGIRPEDERELRDSTADMLCLRFSPDPSSSSFNRFLHPLWPVSRDMFSSLEQNMIRTVEEIKASMKFMDQFHQQLLQEMTLHQNKSVPVLSGGTGGAIKPREDSFTLHLEVQDFSPQELTVKLVGKKLLVTGAKESKCEDGKGSFSYKCQLFRKEADLPDDVIAEKLSCNVNANGQLQIEAPRSVLPDGQERTVPIQLPAVTATTKPSIAGNKNPAST